MESDNNKAQTRIMLFSDIFGISDAFVELAGHLAEDQSLVKLVGPYDDPTLSFYGEDVAYKAFVRAGGVESYIERVELALNGIDSPTLLIGFSAGAAAIWNAVSDISKLKVCDNHFLGFIGFYPGQIRHYLSFTPEVETRLYFPADEPHFDLEEVIKQLTGKKRLKIDKTPYAHGFMNKLSNGYDNQAYQVFLQKLRKKLNRL